MQKQPVIGVLQNRCSELFRKIAREIPVVESASSQQLYYKDIPAQVFFCKFCEICMDIFLTEHLRMTDSVNV